MLKAKIKVYVIDSELSFEGPSGRDVRKLYSKIEKANERQRCERGWNDQERVSINNSVPRDWSREAEFGSGRS